MKPELRWQGEPFVEHWRQISHEALASIHFDHAGGGGLRLRARAEILFSV